ncbi:MAG: undecaprenyl diphosphate synthase family protein [Myxococcales bacterium]|nr:undecaprenyl diphosphate synthase family protein [Myxococcales bacterium]
MKIFYIPDGHRRYADREGISLAQAYAIGYRVLVQEIIEPLFAIPEITHLDIFLLSSLNLKRRQSDDLDVLLHQGEPMLWALIEHCQSMASVRTLGSYLPKNIQRNTVPGKYLTLLLGSSSEENPGCEVTDLFLRSGGELRLSGAPHAVLGNYTQLYAIDALHPDLRFADVEACLSRYSGRYMREEKVA